MERGNKNIQQDDFKEIMEKYSEVPFNNKAILQEYSANNTRALLTLRNLFFISPPVCARGDDQGIFSSIRPARKPNATDGLGNKTYSVDFCTS